MSHLGGGGGVVNGFGFGGRIGGWGMRGGVVGGVIGGGVGLGERDSCSGVVSHGRAESLKERGGRRVENLN